jgi:NTE family protein
MTIKINGQEKRIGLALSGGGFRAACFHLGVMRELHKFGLLAKLDLVSCVSGGSIAGGTLVANWSDLPAALDKLDLYLRTKSIAVSSVICGILDPFHSRLDKLADTYDRDLFSGMKLSALKYGPRVYFNATNLLPEICSSLWRAAANPRKWASMHSEQHRHPIFS